MSNAKWSEWIVKDGLSEFLVEEVISEYEGDIDPETVEILQAVCNDKKEITGLRKVVKSLKKSIPEDTLEELMDELEEMSEDFSWKKSKRGKYVLEIQDWVQTFHSEFLSMECFSKVLIGGHAEHEVVFLTGSVTSEEDYGKLEEYVLSKNPPRKIMNKVIIK